MQQISPVNTTFDWLPGVSDSAKKELEVFAVALAKSSDIGPYLGFRINLPKRNEAAV